jgi:predicted ATPase/DNA-binding SARP family transcriptional activator
MDVRILGPFEVETAAGPLQISGAKRRGLLALLSAHANELVSRDRIVDGLWGPDAPPGADHTVQTYVSQLRKMVADDFAIATIGRGYRVDAPRDTVDATRFLDGARVAEQVDDLVHRRDLLAQALAYWRGPALDDFRGMAWADEVAQALDHRRLEVIEARIDADLALGRARDVIGELEELVHAYPLAEPLWALRMVALYRCGRQADALRAFAEVRSILADELGIEPSRALADLELQILDRSEALGEPVMALGSSRGSGSAAGLPSGTVSFLLTDIVSSTELWELKSSEMAAAVRTHEQIIETTVTASGGHLLKRRGEGDSTMSVFDRAADAMAAAIALQKSLIIERESLPVHLAIRVGLHTGEAEQRDRDYFGRAVNRAARIRSLAGANEILCSRATADLAADSLPPDVALVEIGARQLRGLRRSEVVFRIAYGEEPLTRAPTQPSHNDVERDNLALYGAGRLPSRLEAALRAGPLIGRQHERELLRKCWARASQGQQQLVFVSGEPGIGKTRFAADIASFAAEEGALVLYGRADEGLGVPYQPFLEALREHVDMLDDAVLRPALGRHPGDLLKLLPELAERVADLPPPLRTDPATEQYRLFDAVSSWLEVTSRTAPLVLVLDDLQNAAEPTMLLLRYIAASHPSAKALIVANYRDWEVGRSGTLVGLLADLRTATALEVVQHIELTGLDESDIGTFVDAMRSASLDEAARDMVPALHKQTGGNPFFLHELLRHFSEVGGASVTPLNGGNRGGVHIPAAAREVVLRRVARLSSEAQRVLSIAAVAGNEFEFGIVGPVSGVGDDALLELLEEALAARLLQERELERFSFSHALVQAALYGELTESRRARLHRRVGDAIENLYPARSRWNLSELAFHYAHSVPEKAVHYALAAADAALEATAFEDAIIVCERAVAAVERVRGTSERISTADECDLLLRLGRAEFCAGRRHAREVLIRAYTLAKELQDPRRAADALLAMNRGFFARMGAADRVLIDALEQAISMQPANALAARSALLAALASELEWADDGDRRFDLSDQAVDLARQADDAENLARVLSLRTITITAPDTLGERIANCKELLRLAEENGDPATRFRALWSRSATAVESGDFGVLDQIVEVGARLAAELRQPTFLWQASFMRAARLILRGELEEAESTAASTLELGERAGQHVEAFLFFNEQMLEICRWQDRLADMIRPFRVYAGNADTDFGYTLTRYLYDAGEIDQAREIYDTTMRAEPVPPRRDLLAGMTLCHHAYLAARFRDAERAGVLYDVMLPYGSAFANTTVARPVGDHFLGMLASTLGDFANADSHFERAVATHDRVRAPLLEAETRLEWAHSLIERGSTDRIAELVDVARAAGERHRSSLLVRRGDELAALT